KHAVALHHEHAARLLPGGHRRVGGDVTVANVFVERATDGVDEHLAFEWLQLDCMCGHLRTLDFIQACGTGSYPSTTISRGSPALTANAWTRSAARRSASTIGINCTASTGPLTTTRVIRALIGCLASDRCFRNSYSISIAHW